MHERLASNDRLDYERIGRFIYSLPRFCNAFDELIETGFETNAPRELVERATSIVQKVKHILKNAALTPEGELRSALQEASEVQAEIDKWQSA
ncbi:hypothetical protein [Duganella sp. Root336D2]|uniref:hypothetical protein n=1 Tax=Duganella sp. Root336D2 TaxID=1736518 RepID=UPI0007015442|nr:hypothetical protein [Duganella sp. Root336D2]KQV45984.1 hypothetical protein ASD07_15960 [Duganella sp. Root336D2]